MNYTEPFLRKVETAQEEQQHQHQHHQHQHQPQSGVSYRAAVAANKQHASVYSNIDKTLFFHGYVSKYRF